MFEDEVWSDDTQNYEYTPATTEKTFSVGKLRVTPELVSELDSLSSRQCEQLDDSVDPFSYGVEGVLFYCGELIFDHFAVAVGIERMVSEGLISESLYKAFQDLQTDKIEKNAAYFPEKEVSLIHRVMKVNGIDNPHLLLYDHRRDEVSREIDESLGICPVADEIVTELVGPEKILTETI